MTISDAEIEQLCDYLAEKLIQNKDGSLWEHLGEKVIRRYGPGARQDVAIRLGDAISEWRNNQQSPA